MKLDRNTNRGGRGKYALVNMRKLLPILDRDEDNRKLPMATDRPIANAFRLLVKQGIISLGNETPGDQFFVMKYKDKFTAAALLAYAEAVKKESDRLRSLNGDVPTDESSSLYEYRCQMMDEAEAAQDLGNRIPD